MLRAIQQAFKRQGIVGLRRKPPQISERFPRGLAVFKALVGLAVALHISAHQLFNLVQRPFVGKIQRNQIQIDIIGQQGFQFGIVRVNPLLQLGGRHFAGERAPEYFAGVNWQNNHGCYS